MDKLEQIMDLQKKFGGKFCRFGNLTAIEKDQWTKEFVLACIDELTETLREVNWKHWKQPKTVNEENVKEELIDLLHFVLSLFLVWEMTADDVFNVYINKNKKNHERQNGGY